MEEQHLAEDVIWSFLAGNLTERELDAIEAHLERCDRCSEQLAAWAELGEDVPELFPLERPSSDFADRVMAQVTLQASRPPLYVVASSGGRKLRLSPAFDWFTRTATAAVVTGFMVLGSLHGGIDYSSAPVVGSISAMLAETGTAVSDGTVSLTSKLDQIFNSNWKIAK